MMYEDAQGVLWIATQNGVERFVDGKIEVLSEAGMISGDITTHLSQKMALEVCSSSPPLASFIGEMGLHVAFLFTLILPRCSPWLSIAIPNSGSGSGQRPASCN